MSVPAPGPPRPLKTPSVAERRLRSGLRVYAVRKPGVPKVEVQLIVPTGRRTRSGVAERLLAKTITSGTSKRPSIDIAMELQRLGASLDAGASPDALSLGGSVLAQNLGAYLALMTEILTDAAFPPGEIAIERERAVQDIEMSRSQPQVLAQEAVRKRLFGAHPYALVLPDPAAVAKTGRAAIARAYADRVRPRDANLVVVGEVRPGSALDLVEQTLKTWRGRNAAEKTPDPRTVPAGPTQIVDRPGAVQTNIRFAGLSVSPAHADSYALDCANGIFGGAATSRLFLNIREDKGYTYSPYSTFQHLRHASYFEAGAEVGTEVTAPALVETRYELGRMAAVEVGKEELDAVQRYLIGLMALRIQSQRGLAAVLARLAAFGLGVEYLKDYPRLINAVTTADVLDVAERYLAPGRLVCVLVGDASRIAKSVEALEPVQVVSASA